MALEKGQTEKLSVILEHIINGEDKSATELLHQYIIETSRNEYQKLVEFEDSHEGMVGGDAKQDFAHNIRADMKDIKADHLFDADESPAAEASEEGSEHSEHSEHSEGGEDFEESSDAKLEHEIDELQAQIAELEAKFAELCGEEPGMEAPGAEEVPGMPSEEHPDFAANLPVEMGEATKMSDEHGTPLSGSDMKQEGVFAGTGDKTPGKGKVNTKAPLSKDVGHAPVKGEPVKFTKDGEGKKGDLKADHNKLSNFDIKSKDVKAPSNEEGHYAGTGDKSAKGKVNDKSVLSGVKK